MRWAELLQYGFYKILKDELKNGSSDLVTRPSGQAIRGRIERDFVKGGDRVVVIALDFS